MEGVRMYRIVYRKLDGSTASAVVYACVNEAEARETFLRQYDGRIITVESI